MRPSPPRRARADCRAAIALIAVLASMALATAFAPRAAAAPPTLEERLRVQEEERQRLLERKKTDEELGKSQAIEGAVERGEYRLGPGDRLAVTLRGVLQRSEEVLVGAEGTLLVPPAGGVPVAGLTIDEAQTAVARALERDYRDVEVRIDLLEVRHFEVHVLGHVKFPGTFVVHASTRASNAIEKAGGVLGNGSLRAIQLERRDGTTANVDLHAFLLLGRTAANPVLSDGDRIVVPFAGERAVVGGDLGRQGEYEVLPDETIADLVALAGGAGPGADRSRVFVHRFMSSSGPLTDSIRVSLDDETADTPARPGDQIYVYSIPDWHIRRAVAVRGEVLYPGDYVIEEGRETLQMLVTRAGGLTAEASLGEMTLTRTIGQENYDPEYERLKLIDVGDMTRDEYDYFKLKSREHPGRVVVNFPALFIGGDLTEDVLVRRGDLLNVPIATRSVKVSGQVASPGAIAYEEGKPARWYIERAGGYGWRAAEGKTRVIRARTGEWESARKSKVIEVGDTIWVPEKPERDYWELFKDYLVVAGQIATIYLVVDRIAN
ncbi:MAG: polysaccharide biosynthesis/export family protein [bacterium]